MSRAPAREPAQQRLLRTGDRDLQTGVVTLTTPPGCTKVRMALGTAPHVRGPQGFSPEQPCLVWWGAHSGEGTLLEELVAVG
jgi:hypothetical protein